MRQKVFQPLFAFILKPYANELRLIESFSNDLTGKGSKEHDHNQDLLEIQRTKAV